MTSRSRAREHSCKYDTPSWLATRKARTGKEWEILADFSLAGFRGQRMETKKCSIVGSIFPNLELTLSKISPGKNTAVIRKREPFVFIN